MPNLTVISLLLGKTMRLLSNMDNSKRCPVNSQTISSVGQTVCVIAKLSGENVVIVVTRQHKQ